MKLQLMILLVVFNTSFAVNAAIYSFKYSLKEKIFIMKVNSPSKEDAFKKAASICFQYFTNGTYPGEEQGLLIIDACANPI